MNSKTSTPTSTPRWNSSIRSDEAQNNVFLNSNSPTESKDLNERSLNEVKSITKSQKSISLKKVYI